MDWRARTMVVGPRAPSRRRIETTASLRERNAEATHPVRRSFSNNTEIRFFSVSFFHVSSEKQTSGRSLTHRAWRERGSTRTRGEQEGSSTATQSRRQETPTASGAVAADTTAPTHPPRAPQTSQPKPGHTTREKAQHALDSDSKVCCEIAPLIETTTTEARKSGGDGGEPSDRLLRSLLGLVLGDTASGTADLLRTVLGLLDLLAGGLLLLL